MSKPVNNRADAWKADVYLLFTMTNCQIVRSRALPHRINYKSMCLSAYWRYKLAGAHLKLANERAKICVIVKSTSTIHRHRNLPVHTFTKNYFKVTGDRQGNHQLVLFVLLASYFHPMAAIIVKFLTVPFEMNFSHVSRFIKLCYLHWINIPIRSFIFL